MQAKLLHVDGCDSIARVLELASEWLISLKRAVCCAPVQSICTTGNVVNLWLLCEACLLLPLQEVSRVPVLAGWNGNLSACWASHVLCKTACPFFVPKNESGVCTPSVAVIKANRRNDPVSCLDTCEYVLTGNTV